VSFDVPVKKGSTKAVGPRTAASGSTGHASNYDPLEVHTRVVSFCRPLPLTADAVQATTYRSRWYGWQWRGSRSAARVGDITVTVPVACERHTWYRYRTTATATVSVAGRPPITRNVYGQNDDEIECSNPRYWGF
jgi:hypothetical protein